MTYLNIVNCNAYRYTPYSAIALPSKVLSFSSFILNKLCPLIALLDGKEQGID